MGAASRPPSDRRSEGRVAAGASIPDEPWNEDQDKGRARDMSLQARIESDFVQAYKAKDQLKVAVLRMLKTAVKNRQVELVKPLEPLTDESVLDIILKQAKQRQESIEQYRNAGRADLLDQETAELAVLESYLPAPFSPEELAAVVDRTVADLGASGRTCFFFEAELIIPVYIKPSGSFPILERR